MSIAASTTATTATNTVRRIRPTTEAATDVDNNVTSMSMSMNVGLEERQPVSLTLGACGDLIHTTVKSIANVSSLPPRNDCWGPLYRAVVKCSVFTAQPLVDENGGEIPHRETVASALYETAHLWLDLYGHTYRAPDAIRSHVDGTRAIVKYLDQARTNTDRFPEFVNRVSMGYDQPPECCVCQDSTRSTVLYGVCNHGSCMTCTAAVVHHTPTTWGVILRCPVCREPSPVLFDATGKALKLNALPSYEPHESEDQIRAQRMREDERYAYELAHSRPERRSRTGSRGLSATEHTAMWLEQRTMMRTMIRTIDAHLRALDDYNHSRSVFAAEAHHNSRMPDLNIMDRRERMLEPQRNLTQSYGRARTSLVTAFRFQSRLMSVMADVMDQRRLYSHIPNLQEMSQPEPPMDGTFQVSGESPAEAIDLSYDSDADSDISEISTVVMESVETLPAAQAEAQPEAETEPEVLDVSTE